MFLAGGFVPSCKKNGNKDVCNVKNPLTDLPWLATKVEEYTSFSQNNSLRVTIYQCMYGDGQTGFLEDLGSIKPFYNCEGDVLCVLGGVVGETCPHLNIDLANKKLIWEINN